jgi:glycosyltransferase involved in cell wall biosynthesis
MQAMMCRLPCVTTDVGAIGEIAVHGRTAWIVPPQDAGALGEALARLMADATQRAALSEAARSFALAHCTFAEMCTAMEEVFREARRGEKRS